MGCGHSKINIYPKKYKNRNSPKKSVTPEKPEPEEEEIADNDFESSEKLEDCDARRTIKVKPFGGPLLAQVEISSSQQNFFKMLDEKIDSGPDYDSASEAERAAEAARLRALLKDWETASAGSRSLPSTPIRRPKMGGEKYRNGNEPMRYAPEMSMRSNEIAGNRIHSQIPPNIIHQSYGVAQPTYRQTTYNPVYQQQPGPLAYSSAMQYQALSPMYIAQGNYHQQQPPPPSQTKHYPSYNQHGSPIKMVYQNSAVKHIPYDQPQITYSPSHKVYGSVVPKSPGGFTNGELLVQQQMYNQQIQYQQTREYQQYRQSKEQMLLQQQGYQTARNYQSSVHIPIVMHTPQTDVSPLHRKQYEMT